MSAKKNRLTILPVYSIILCMMVVLIHNHIPHYYEYGDNPVNNSIHYFLIEIIPNITDIAVPSFFMLSGFLFFRNYDLNKTLEKYKSRIKTLLVPYLIWNAAGLLFEMVTRIPCFATLGKVNSNPFLLKSILCGIFLHQYTVLWFVFALIIYVIGAPIFYLLMKRKFGGILSLIVVVCCLVFDIIQVQLPNGCYFEESSLLYYMLGAYLGIHNKQFYGIKASFVQAVVSILVFFALMYCELTFQSYLYRFDTLILVAKSLSFWFFCSWACRFLKLRYWYNYSFFIYLCHLPLIRAISAIIRLLGNPIKNMLCIELLSYVLSFVITMLMCVTLAFIWKKYSNKSFNLVTGSRG